ncbi:MAG: TonB-dependent receptor, partial [bacterium]
MRRMAAVMAAAAVVTAVAAEAFETNLEIVVTASRNSRQASQMPANVTVMTAADIEKAGYGSIVDAIRDAGGISFRSSSGNESQAEVQMRGFGENSGGRLLVLLDGQRLNRPDMAGINWLQIPLGNVERVEILRGSDSVSYGDHAVGGVINIVTKKGTRDPEVFTHISGGSYGENTERAGYSASSGKLTYAINAERQQTDGYRERSAFSALGAAGSVSYDINEMWNANIGFSYNDAEFELPGWLTKDQVEIDPRQSGNPSDSADNKYYNINFNTTCQLGSMGSASLGVVFGRTAVRSDMVSWFSYSDWVIDSFGLTPNFVFNSSILGHKNKLLLGVDYYMDGLKVDRFSEVERLNVTSTADVDKQTLGTFFKNELAISDVLTLGAGARFEKADVSASGNQLFEGEQTHNANSVNVSLIYRFERESKIFAKAGTVYRYPFVDEQVFYSGFGMDHFNTTLQAEAGTDLQLGAEVGINKNIRTGLTLFLMNMRDEIVYNPVTSDNENMDKTRHSGAEASMSWKVTKGFAVDANYTYTEALFIGGANEGKDIPLVPQHAGSIGATLALPYDLSLRTAA